MEMPSSVAATGWAAIAVFPLTVAWAYFSRGRFASASQPYRARLRPHYVFGYVVLGAASAHAALAMMRGTIASAGPLGINAAYWSLGLFAVQVFLGACLLDPGSYRGALRAWHFRLMIAAGACAAIHVLLNAPAIGMPPL